jgi:hypothetical protein
MEPDTVLSDCTIETTAEPEAPWPLCQRPFQVPVASTAAGAAGVEELPLHEKHARARSADERTVLEVVERMKTPPCGVDQFVGAEA